MPVERGLTGGQRLLGEQIDSTDAAPDIHADGRFCVAVSIVHVVSLVLAEAANLDPADAASGVSDDAGAGRQINRSLADTAANIDIIIALGGPAEIHPQFA